MERLRRRADFLAAAKGRRAGMRAFTLQARQRDASDAAETVRYGLTVTKKVGNAVERNRIKRRLRAAIRFDGGMAFVPGFDYVVVARREMLKLPFTDITTDLALALRRVHGIRDQRTKDETARP
jgi:ribonuclease P protein component